MLPWRKNCHGGGGNFVHESPENSQVFRFGISAIRMRNTISLGSRVQLAGKSTWPWKAALPLCVSGTDSVSASSARLDDSYDSRPFDPGASLLIVRLSQRRAETNRSDGGRQAAASFFQGFHETYPLFVTENEKSFRTECCLLRGLIKHADVLNLSNVSPPSTA